MFKRIAIALATVFALASTANADPTCHQRVTLTKSDHSQNAYAVAQKVKKMVLNQSLDLISATSNVDIAVKGKAYVDAVATATADVLDTPVNDGIKVLLAQSMNSMVKDISSWNKSFKDPVSLNSTVAGRMSMATDDIIVGFLACAK